MNLLTNREISKGNVSFYAWECLTLQLDEKDVYLVIKNENCMTKLIKLLIYSLSTIDGNRDTANGIKKALLA